MIFPWFGCDFACKDPQCAAVINDTPFGGPFPLLPEDGTNQTDPNGAWARNDGSCGAGEYSGGCATCEAGFTPDAASEKCVACPVGTFAPAAAANCTACGAGEVAGSLADPARAEDPRFSSSISSVSSCTWARRRTFSACSVAVKLSAGWLISPAIFSDVALDAMLGSVARIARSRSS